MINRVKFFVHYDIDVIEKEVNKFVKKRDVINITMTVDSNLKFVSVIYRQDEKKKKDDINE